MSAEGTKIPSFMSRIMEMFGANDDVSKSVASMVTGPLLAAGGVGIAKTMTESVASIGRDSLGTYTPAQTPGMPELAISRGTGAGMSIKK